MSDRTPLEDLARAIENAEATAPSLTKEPAWTLEAEPAIVTEHQAELFNS